MIYEIVFCCDELRYYFTILEKIKLKLSIGKYDEHKIVYIIKPEIDGVRISHCPFCGKIIEIRIKDDYVGV
ncbi:MAG: hypothetical protein ACTSUK_03975 [Promethearchaeota archaeon]